jgi:ATP-dependent DNA helicase RecG
VKNKRIWNLKIRIRDLRGDRTYFATTLYIHPDFGKHQNDGVINGVINGAINLKPNEERIIECVKKNPNITVKELAELLEVGTSTIDRAIKTLKQKGILTRQGSNKKKEWVLLRR